MFSYVISVLNNFPLHTFDFLSQAPAPQCANLRPLHTNILGLRPTDGYPPGATSRNVTTPPGTFELLLRNFGDVMGTVLYPSEEGLICSPDEADQTIDLNTYDRKTTDFAPPSRASATPIEAAEQSVSSYFGSIQ